jgi:hypothetical protein
MYLEGHVGVDRSGGSGTRQTARRDRVVPGAEVEAPVPRTWIESIPHEAPPSGEGRITGQVVDADGAPVPGVLIVADPQSRNRSSKPEKGRGAPPDVDLVAEVEKYVARRRTRIESRKTARTGEDGRYTLERLAPTPHRLHAYLEGQDVSPRDMNSVYRAQPGSEIDFVARPLVRLPVEVVMSDGSAPEGAAIGLQRREARGSWSGGGEPWTRGSPFIELTPGRYRIDAYVQDDPTARAKPIDVSVVPGQKPAPVTLTILVKPKISIRVVRPDGFENSRIHVRAALFTPERIPTDDELERSRIGPGSAAFASDVVTLENLEPGRYRVGAGWAYSGSLAVTTSVDVSQRSVATTLTLPPPDPADFLRARVLDPQGRSVAVLQWSEELRAGRRRRRGSVQSFLADDQTHYIRCTRLEEEGEHTLHARSELLGTLAIPLDGAMGGVVAARFEEPAYVDVRIPGYARSGCVGRLVAGLQAGHRFTRRTVPIDAEGKARVGPMQPCEAELVLSIAANQSSYEIARKKIRLASGDNPTELAVPRLHEFRFVWKGEGKPVVLLQSGTGGRGDTVRLEVDSNGVAEFRDIPAGEYRLAVANVGFRGGRRVVRIPETTEVTLP